MARLTRRQFLALGAAAVSVPALARASGEKPWNDRVSRPIRKYSESVKTACIACASHCSLVAYRQEGRVAAVIPENGGCPRGTAAHEALYDGERLTVPLKRFGQRGSGEWERISWEEAATLVASALREAGSNSVADLGRPDPLAASLLPLLGFSTVTTAEATRSWGSRKARKELYGSEIAESDLSGARTVILFGANVLDGGADFARSTSELVKAKEAGATVVLVSPRAGSTGSWADRWIPVKPGCEAQAALALAALLADGSNDARLKEKFGGDPAELREALLRATKAGVAGVAAEDLKWLAARFLGGPVAVRCDGSGLSGAGALEAAAAVLNALGGASRLRPAPKTGLEIAATASGEKVAAALVGGKRYGVCLAYRANPAHSMPQAGEVSKALKDTGRAGLVVAFDTHLTETALCADLVLPAPSDLECWNVVAGLTPNGSTGYLLGRPVQIWGGETAMLKAKNTPLADLFDGPKPGAVGEAKQLGDFLLMVARTLGKSVPAKSAAEAAANEAAKLGFKAGSNWVSTNAQPVEWKADQAVAAALLRSAKAPAEGGLTLVPVDCAELDPAFANFSFGREIRPENPVCMNAATAKKLGLAKGDRVVVKSSQGAVSGPLFPLQTLHPDAVALARDFGHTASGSKASAKAPEALAPVVKTTRKEFMRVAYGEVKERFKATGHGAPHGGPKGPGVNVAALAPLSPDGEGAAYWRETPVTVSKG